MASATPRSHAFPKKERLSSKKLIEGLFKNGSSFYLYPLLLRYQSYEGDCHQVLITVSKKKHKRAVDRNKIKRRLREAYRTNKHLLQSDQKFLVGIVYLSDELLPFQEIQDKLIRLLQRLQKTKKE
ncbi:MAG: ribonuclease P protein component [Cyclobacteriaceae bacterium]|nr:ribonuclease P protein component [Cyclobacteriaceae bacterium HetDA_MAG_MS6]